MAASAGASGSGAVVGVLFLKNYNNSNQGERVDYTADTTFGELADLIRVRQDILDDAVKITIRRQATVFARDAVVASVPDIKNGGLCYHITGLPAVAPPPVTAATPAPPQDTSRTARLLVEVELEAAKTRRETVLAELCRIQAVIQTNTARLASWGK